MHIFYSRGAFGSIVFSCLTNGYFTQSQTVERVSQQSFQLGEEGNRIVEQKQKLAEVLDNVE